MSHWHATIFDMRLLPYVRLSVLDDQSTSPERQFEKIETFARIGGHGLVRITEADYDLNVSGSVNPFERPGLGPWLRDDRLDMWDAICVAKLDRLTRSLFDFVTLVSWLEAQGKSLFCIDPMLDLTTPAGRAFASITATFAEFERETIAARVRDAYDKLVRDGQYAGGQVPFGYRPMKLARGWGYEPDPEYQPVVAEMFDRYAGYESLGSITRWLNDTGVPTLERDQEAERETAEGDDMEADQRPEDPGQSRGPRSHGHDRGRDGTGQERRGGIPGRRVGLQRRLRARPGPDQGQSRKRQDQHLAPDPGRVLRRLQVPHVRHDGQVRRQGVQVLRVCPFDTAGRTLYGTARQGR